MKKNLKYIILALVAIVFVGTFVALWKNSRPKEIRYEQLEATVKDIHPQDFRRDRKDHSP